MSESAYKQIRAMLIYRHALWPTESELSCHTAMLIRVCDVCQTFHEAEEPVHSVWNGCGGKRGPAKSKPLVRMQVDLGFIKHMASEAAKWSDGFETALDWIITNS